MKHLYGHGSITRTNKNKAIWCSSFFNFLNSSYIPSDPCSASLPITIMHAYLLLTCLMPALLDNKYNLFYSIIEKGEEHCGHLIEAHKECMRALGFKI